MALLFHTTEIGTAEQGELQRLFVVWWVMQQGNRDKVGGLDQGCRSRTQFSVREIGHVCVLSLQLEKNEWCTHILQGGQDIPMSESNFEFGTGRYNKRQSSIFQLISTQLRVFPFKQHIRLRSPEVDGCHCHWVPRDDWDCRSTARWVVDLLVRFEDLGEGNKG